ncbi:MAG: hypothetical protein AAF417_06895 [Pseudomonadota bacterium]
MTILPMMSGGASGDAARMIVNVLFAGCLTLSTVAVAQDTLGLGEPIEESLDEPIEEVVVIGEKSMRTLRHAVYRAEENFFETFSRLNDDDEFDVRCFFEAPTGTRIRRHVCRANFLVAATSSEAEVWRSDGPGLVAAGSSQALLERKKKELQQRVEAMVVANPELASALAEYTAAKTEHDEERAERDAKRQE